MTEKELQLREKKEIKEAEATREGPLFTPEVDIYEQESSLVLVADVPGGTTEHIDLDLQDNILNLTAGVTPVENKWKPIYVEYEIGHFTRQFRIGQLVDTSKIEAQVRDGVLTITLPKAEKAIPRRIEVKAE